MSGMSDAAKSARGAFTDIKSGANDMGKEVGSSMGSARQGVMLLGDEFGIHLPRGLTMFIASLGPVGAAMEAAFPFIAIMLGATLLIEHLAKLHEAGIKLTEDQIKFGTAAQNAFNSLDEKMLRSGIRADELRNDHVGALHKELALINMQSMDDLIHTFSELAKSADITLAGLKKSWYEIGSGSARAKQDMDEFQAKYAALLAKRDDAGATDLLKGTKESAEKVLALQKQAASTGGYGAAASGGGPMDHEEQLKLEEAIGELKKTNHQWDESAIKSQQLLIDLLNNQVQAEQQSAGLKKMDSANANTGAAKAASAEQATAAKAAAESSQRIGENAIAADRTMANARLEIQHASIQQRLANDLSFAERELQLQLAGNQRQIAALSKMANDYPNQLKAMHEKAEELTSTYSMHVAEITAKAQVEQNNRDLAELEEGERNKIDATARGSAARLAAIDAALKEEAARNMQELSSYRQLLSQRVQTVREAAEEEAKIRADAGHEAADNAEKMASMAFAAQKEHAQLMLSERRVNAQQQMQIEVQAANLEYAAKLTAMQMEEAALDKGGKDYLNKLQAIQNKEKQLVQQHENEITAIRDKAEEQRNARILSADQRFNDSIAQGMTQLLMGHKTFAQTMTQLGNQVHHG